MNTNTQPIFCSIESEREYFAEMRILKNPISCSPAPWNVTTAYLNKKNSAAILATLRKLETVGKPSYNQKTVTVNGIETVYTLGKKNEYFDNYGISLTKVLESLATGTGNKISIR